MPFHGHKSLVTNSFYVRHVMVLSTAPWMRTTNERTVAVSEFAKQHLVPVWHGVSNPLIPPLLSLIADFLVPPGAVCTLCV